HPGAVHLLRKQEVVDNAHDIAKSQCARAGGAEHLPIKPHRRPQQQPAWRWSSVRVADSDAAVLVACSAYRSGSSSNFSRHLLEHRKKLCPWTVRIPVARSGATCMPHTGSRSIAALVR